MFMRSLISWDDAIIQGVSVYRWMFQWLSAGISKKVSKEAWSLWGGKCVHTQTPQSIFFLLATGVMPRCGMAYIQQH